VLDKLSADHHVVHALLEELDRALVGMLSGGELDGVRDTAERLQEVLVAHLDYEEQQLVGPLDRLGYF
jgi:hemerythrin-like domain-containing protein